MLVTAIVNVALAYVTNLTAGRYRDARLNLVSLAFLASASFGPIRVKGKTAPVDAWVLTAIE